MQCKPTTEELIAEFPDLDESSAELIHELCAAVDSDASPDPLESMIDSDPRLESTERYVRQMHSSPYYLTSWRVTVAFHAIDEILGTYGVESIGPCEDCAPYSPRYEYCNTGDSYTSTLILNCSTNEVEIGCWADYVDDPSDQY